MCKNKRELGSLYEERAVLFLKEQGLRILERNYRCRSGEIDIIAKDHHMFVFVEVKYRSCNSAGRAAEAVNLRKQKMISKVADYYLYTRVRSFDVPCRFDVVAFDGEEISWIKNAFERR